MQTTTKKCKMTKNKCKTAKYRRDHQKETQSICCFGVCFTLGALFLLQEEQGLLHITEHFSARWVLRKCVCLHAAACICQSVCVLTWKTACWTGPLLRQMRRRDVRGGREKHWCAWASLLKLGLTFWANHTLQAAVEEGVGPEVYKTLLYKAANIVDGNTFPCYTIPFCPSVGDTLPGSASNLRSRSNALISLFPSIAFQKALEASNPHSIQCRYYIYEWKSEVECHFPPPTLCKHWHALWIWYILTSGTCITKVIYAVAMRWLER